MSKNLKLQIRQLDASDAGFDSQLKSLLAWESVANDKVTATVARILADIKDRGDQALLEYTQQFDQLSASNVAELEISKAEQQQTLQRINAEDRDALEQAADRIRRYHQKQKQESWSYVEADGTLLGQQIRALDRVGIYVPGGKAAYPSSVLMNAIPARVAGVDEIIMVVPTPAGAKNDMVIAAAAIAGVDCLFTIGGAQAIAALAYGTETIPRVDKIVGPGNIYVATAKRQVFGAVGIDMIAGPSEILVFCDGKTDPDWIAMDLFSQAEHDQEAQALLVSQDQIFLDAVAQSMARLLPEMERKDIIAAAINNRSAFIKVGSLAQGVDIINQVAPEHLELSLADPQAMLPSIRHAGAIFMGRHTAEALGDYCAGPNHVLPTSGTARYSSPLGVYDFQKRSSLIQCSAEGASRLGRVAARLAYAEGFQAHARSAEYRVKTESCPANQNNKDEAEQ